MWATVRVDYDQAIDSDVSPTDKVAHGQMMYQAADWSFSFTVLVGGQPVDFSNRTWLFKLIDGNRTVYTTSTVTGDANGTVSGNVVAADSAALTLTSIMERAGNKVASCGYELTSTSISGGVDRVAEGVILISLAGS